MLDTHKGQSDPVNPVDNKVHRGTADDLHVSGFGPVSISF